MEVGVRAVARSMRLPTVAAVVLAALAVAVLTRGRTLGLGLGSPLLTSWLSMIAAAAASVVPLSRSLGPLEASCVRAPVLRLVRICATGVIAVASALVFDAIDDTGAVSLTLLALVALGVAIAPVLGDVTAVVVLGVGLAVVLVDHLLINAPISGALIKFSSLGVAMLAGAAVAVHLAVSDLRR